jgi:hypothetical protein
MVDPVDMLSIPDFAAQMERFRASDEARQALLHVSIVSAS